MTEIVSIALTNEPGSLAHALLSLAARGVNVSAMQTESLGEIAVARFVVDDVQHAVSVLREAGHPVQVLPALRVSAAGGTRALGEIARRLGLAGVTVRHAMVHEGEMTLVPDDVVRAREALGIVDEASALVAEAAVAGP